MTLSSSTILSNTFTAKGLEDNRSFKETSSRQSQTDCASKGVDQEESRKAILATKLSHFRTEICVNDACFLWQYLNFLRNIVCYYKISLFWGARKVVILNLFEVYLPCSPARYPLPFVNCFLITDNAPQLKETLRYEWCTVAVFIVVNCCWCYCCCCRFALRAVFFVCVDTSLSCIWTIPWYNPLLTCNGC